MYYHLHPEFCLLLWFKNFISLSLKKLNTLSTSSQTTLEFEKHFRTLTQFQLCCLKSSLELLKLSPATMPQKGVRFYNSHSICYKVPIFWEGYKIWKKSLSDVKNKWEIFSKWPSQNIWTLPLWVSQDKYVHSELSMFHRWKTIKYFVNISRKSKIIATS